MEIGHQSVTDAIPLAFKVKLFLEILTPFSSTYADIGTALHSLESLLTAHISQHPMRRHATARRRTTSRYCRRLPWQLSNHMTYRGGRQCLHRNPGFHEPRDGYRNRSGGLRAARMHAVRRGLYRPCPARQPQGRIQVGQPSQRGSKSRAVSRPGNNVATTMRNRYPSTVHGLAID